MEERELGPGSKIGSHQIVSEIGAGGMGKVFLAQDLGLDRLVAIKVLSKELSKDELFLKRFALEGKSLAKVQHPSVVNVFAIGNDGPYHFLVMEYVRGGNLKSLAKSESYLLGDILPIFKAVTEGLQAIHNRNLCHRDIKPSNILMDEDYRPKIADFGIAKHLEHTAYDITETGNAMGTAPYMAPEVLKDGNYSHLSDIYALGLVFFELLAGFNPFSAANAMGVYEKLKTTKLKFPDPLFALLPWELRHTIEKMCALEISLRPQTAQEVLELLAQVPRSLPNGLPLEGRWPEKKREIPEEVVLRVSEGKFTCPAERAAALSQWLLAREGRKETKQNNPDPLSESIPSLAIPPEEDPPEAASQTPKKTRPAPKRQEEETIELDVDPRELAPDPIQYRPKRKVEVKLEVERHDKPEEENTEEAPGLLEKLKFWKK